jgi:hypothetical protein
MPQRSRPLRAYLPPGVPEDEEAAQVLVLALLLCVYPRGMTVLGLALELSRDEREDWVERAVRELVGAGLVRCQGCVVFPTLDRPSTEQPRQGKPASQ